MKIAKLELENVKRVRAVMFEPELNGINIIGGKNGQGKTSVLDAIAWALGGEKYRPSTAQREGSVLPPKLHIVMDNGIVVDRDGKNSALKVTDPTGQRAGQALLDEFVEKLALDLPKFMSQSNKDKASTLLRVIGMEDKIKELDAKESSAYNRRHALGQIADQKRKYAAELPDYPDAPAEPVSVSDLIEQQQAILLKNAENQKKRDQVDSLIKKRDLMLERSEDLSNQIARLIQQQEAVVSDLRSIELDLETAKKTAAELEDESTEELEESIRSVDEINIKVRANLDKEKAQHEADEISEQYNALTAEIEETRKERTDLLNSAKLPLSGLTVENGELLYHGKAWDCMSGSEQLIVAVAIVKALNPKCGFVLLDKTEQMDQDTLSEFGKWLEDQKLQAICTRVSTGDECEIIIEDGVIVKQQSSKKSSAEKKDAPVMKLWKEGEF